MRALRISLIMTNAVGSGGMVWKCTWYFFVKVFKLCYFYLLQTLPANQTSRFALQLQFGSITKLDFCNHFRRFAFRTGVFREFQITLLIASKLAMQKLWSVRWTVRTNDFMELRMSATVYNRPVYF